MKKNIIPITDLRKTNEILNLVKENEVVHITKNGYSEMVIMSSEKYDDFSLNPSNKKNEIKHLYAQELNQDHCHGFVNIGTYSLPVKIGNVKANTELIIEAIKRAIEKKISILVLPELSICGYTCGDLLSHSSLHDQIKVALKKIKDFLIDKEILVFIGAPIFFNDALYNCAVAMQNGKILAFIPKRHLPTYKEFYETRYFTPYKEENTYYIFDNEKIPFGNKIILQNDYYLNEVIGCDICEDAWVSHSPSLDAVEAGATVIVNLSASNETIAKNNTREILVKEASRKLNCVYIFSSSSYEESTTDLLFSGECLVGECGDIIKKSELFFPNDLDVTIDISRVKNHRRYLTPVVSNQKDNFIVCHYASRRNIPEHIYNRRLSRYPFVYNDFSMQEVNYDKILTMQALGLVRRLKAINGKKVVLGLSGGLDSTLALLVCIKAYEILNYDKKDIIAITLPCFGTSKRTYNNALTIAEKLGNTLIEIDISNAVSQHLKDIDHINHNYDITYENAQARERTKVLMDYANKVNGIVIGTGDLSEIALGWSTYNGDHMSMYAVNSSIPKTLIKGMFNYFAYNTFKEIKDVLLDILDTPISPELIPSKDDTIQQKTEDIIGSYILHDFFLYHLMNEYYSFSKIYFMAKITFKNEFTNEEIKKWLKSFIKRFFTSQFKRSCMPDGVKVTSVSLSPRGDLRLPSDISYQGYLDEIDSLD